jgi:hypothetical protein
MFVCCAHTFGSDSKHCHCEEDGYISSCLLSVVRCRMCSKSVVVTIWVGTG